jgi:hypothetical protein
MSIPEAPGLFADAVVTDQSTLVFLSLWGRDTAIQEFVARLSVPVKEGGMDSFWLEAEDSTYVQVGGTDRLQKDTGRMPKTNIFGDVVHLWLYDRLAFSPDYANRRALLFYRPGEEQTANTSERLWALVKETCHLPLLDHWRETVLEGMTTEGWIKRLDGIGLSAFQISLPESEVQEVVQRWICQHQLTVDETSTAHVQGADGSDHHPFADEQIISVYTRVQAIADGVLIDVSETAAEAGFRCAVALTQGVYAECVAWGEEDSLRQTHQDESGRLWDVVWMAANAARTAKPGETRTPFQLYCVPCDGKSHKPKSTTLHLNAGAGDEGEMVMTIMLPGED